MITQEKNYYVTGNNNKKFIEVDDKCINEIYNQKNIKIKLLIDSKANTYGIQVSSPNKKILQDVYDNILMPQSLILELRET